MAYATTAALNAEIARAKAAEASLQAQVNALKPTPPPTGVPLSYVPTPSAAVPAYLTPTADPTWGTTITRISNTAGWRHAYSRIQPWNADGTKLLLGFTPSAGRMLDGNTYADLGSFHPMPYAMWSNVDPTFLYGVNGNALVRQNATTGALTTVHDYGAPVSIGNYEGGVSDDDQSMLISFGSTLALVNPTTGAIVTQITLPAGLDNFQVSRKGNYGVLVGGTTRKVPRALTPQAQLYGLANHGDNWYDGTTERFLANSTGNGVQSFRLSDAAMTILIPEGSAFGYGHSSGRGPLPVFSNYDTGAVTANKPGHDQIVSVNADGTVNVYGFAHHTTVQDGSPGAYLSQPHACPSRDGKRAIFASDWGGGSVYAYIATLP